MDEILNARVISIAILLFLLFGGAFVLIPSGAMADKEGDYFYTVNNGNATVTGYEGAGGAITIPSTLGGYPIVAIGIGAFDSTNGKMITSVVIPNGVTTIGNGAFYSCINMTSITIPNGVTSIGDWSFFECSSLTSITIPGSVASIGDYAFYACHSLESVIIPDGVESLGYAVFSWCDSLESVSISASVASIGESVFEYCPSLIVIDVDEDNSDYASIDGVLYNESISTLITCPGGKVGNLTIPDGVITIGALSCYYCQFLTNVAIPGTVTSIGWQAFIYCYNLTSIEFMGQIPPVEVGDNWISMTSEEIRGHAHASSDFPVPGEDFHTLTMGEFIPEEGSNGEADNTLIYLGIGIVVVLAVIIIAVLFFRQKK